MNYVIYRAGDRLQSLSWRGNGDLTYENLTTGADAVGAQGDPAPYLSGQVNVVVYRAVDNHIRSIYWTEGGRGSTTSLAWRELPTRTAIPACTTCPANA